MRFSIKATPDEIALFREACRRQRERSAVTDPALGRLRARMARRRTEAERAGRVAGERPESSGYADSRDLHAATAECDALVLSHRWNDFDFDLGGIV